VEDVADLANLHAQFTVKPRPAARTYATMSLSCRSLPRALCHRETRFCFRDDKWAFLARWDPAAGEFLFEGFEKVDRGIRHYAERSPDGTIDRFLARLALRGVYSERPYILTRAAERGAHGFCELALFRHFCEGHGLEPDTVYRWGYPTETPPDWIEITFFAEWQGVIYPSAWDTVRAQQLLRCLREPLPVLRQIIEATVKDHGMDLGAA
jgi:hypothetical protein